MGLHKRKKKYSRICATCTVYSLLEYLLYSSYEEIKDTFFIFEDWMFPDFGNKFDNCYKMPAGKSGLFWNPNLLWIRWYFIKWFKLPSFKNTQLFTLDHLSYHSVFIGKREYTLLDDGPNCHVIKNKDNVPYSVFEEREMEHLPTIKQRLLFLFRKKIYGPVYYNRWGKSSLCRELILSTDEYLDYFEGKNLHRINIKGLWKSFTKEKQDLILDVFNMNYEDLEILTTKKIIVLTQPLYPDYISKEEHQKIWKAIISKYPESDILVKPHPRDSYEYENDFDGVSVFRKKVPSQLFELLDLGFTKAVTTFTSAVFGLNAKEIDWYGTEVSDKILARLGSEPFIPEGMKVNKCFI